MACQSVLLEPVAQNDVGAVPWWNAGSINAAGVRPDEHVSATIFG